MVTVRLELQPAFVLHTRAFRDSSLIVDCFTKDYGRISLMARGVKREKSREKKALLQPFVPLKISAQGKGEMLTLIQIELSNKIIELPVSVLFCGLYLNELLVKLLQPYDPCPDLFATYNNALQALSSNEATEKVLRIFEMQLLQALGYQLCLHQTIVGVPVQADCYYQFNWSEGLKLVEDNAKDSYLGAHLLAIDHLKFNDQAVVLTAKKLMRRVLAVMLGNKTLKTREIYGVNYE